MISNKKTIAISAIAIASSNNPVCNRSISSSPPSTSLRLPQRRILPQRLRRQFLPRMGLGRAGAAVALDGAAPGKTVPSLFYFLIQENVNSSFLFRAMLKDM